MESIVGTGLIIFFLLIVIFIAVNAARDPAEAELERERVKERQAGEKAKAERLKWEADHPNWEAENEEIKKILRNL